MPTKPALRTRRESLPRLLTQVRQCRLCEPQLPLGAHPIFQLGRGARILIASQAPGRVAHVRGLPFDDVSGDRLRHWLGVDRETFYDPAKFAILPMGLCFPGSGKGGDAPPRPECAPQWRARLLAQLPDLELTLLFGQYALNWHLPQARGKPLTATVARWREFLPTHLPMPHPSPRNQRWLRQQPWFETDVLPELRQRVRALLKA